MKKLILLLIPIIFFANIISAKAYDVKLYFFHGDGCPHCAEEEEYLEELEDKYDYLEVIEFEVWYDENNANLMYNVAATFGTAIKGVPYTVIGNYDLNGYSSSFEKVIAEKIEEAHENGSANVVSAVIDAGKSIDIDDVKKEDTTVTIPLIGEVDAKSFSLPLIAAAIGIVDGFNPCAMWILIFLIGFLITTKDRKKMWVLGSVFLFTSAFIYMLFMMSWLTISIQITKVIWIRTAIAVIALIAGLINLRSYHRSKKLEVGCEVVDNKKRKSIMIKIKKFVLEKNIFLAILGIMALAISVNFIELACSAGLPLLFTSVLSMNNLPNVEYFSYILIYILFFLLDDLIIFAISMFTFKVTGLSNKYSKYSHLIGGIVMFIIGLLLIIKPEWVMFNF